MWIVIHIRCHMMTPSLSLNPEALEMRQGARRRCYNIGDSF